MTADGSAEPTLEFRVLGPLEVRRSGVPLPLGGRQQRAILAVLLCHAGHAVSTGKIADALWGEQPPPGFVASVQTYISHLREVLEPGRARGAAGRVVVTAPSGGYRLDLVDGSTDAEQFERLLAAGTAALECQDNAGAADLLDQALAMWRGDVLADLADFDFVAPFAARLEELRLAALESQTEATLALGRHVGAAAELDRLVTENPMRERLHALRILALYRSGRQSDALAAYRHVRTLLREELGIEPSPPLRTLHRAVLDQDPTLDWHPNLSTPPAPVVRADEPAAAERPPHSEPPVQPPATPTRLRRRSVTAAAVAVLLVLGAVTTAVVRMVRDEGGTRLLANGVGALEVNGTVSLSVPVGTNPAGLVVGGGSLWVANRSDRSVSRIDPRTRAVTQKIDVGLSPEALAVTAGDVWVANFADGTVTRINMAANRVVATIVVGTQPAAIGSGPSGVWVANSADNTIQRLDPKTGRAGTPVAVGDGPDGIAVDVDSVWVANGRDGTVSRVDPRSGEEVTSPIRVGSGPKGIAVSGDAVWVANHLSQSVSRIDRASGVAHSIAVGDGPNAVAVGPDGVWVSEQFAGALTRIDPHTEVVTSFPLGTSPRGVASGFDRVWVASGAFGDPRHTGGTLTIASGQLPGHSGGIDPAQVYVLPTLAAERLVYDGLVASRAANADSQVLVPDLATALPQPSNGGKRYTFTLRPGIRYSTGQQVRAADFVLGVRRALTLPGRPDFFAGIVGAQRCLEHHDSCDLSRGVVTDEAHRRVTFHLTSPDPEFLYKLTFFVYPTPPGTSLKTATSPLPGTGPYMIGAYARDTQFELQRNPWFHRWSVPAQPDGYPDAIRWLKVRDTRAAADAVTSGRADLAQLTTLDDRRASESLVEDLSVRFPAQVHSDLTGGTAFEVLNAAVPPFNNLQARQAVNYAVDRRRLVELYGGPAVAVETCQLLPPKFPSYAWYCPYTIGPRDGRYHGPDLAKARALVKASGTTGMEVVVHDVVGGLVPPFGSYFAQLLRQLGYKVTLHQMPDSPATDEFLFSGRHRLQVQSGGWLADFPLASNFYYAQIACGSRNFISEYCNRALDERAVKATALEAVDPGDAVRAWTAIDRAVTDDAAIVPAVNSLDWWFTSARVGNYQSNTLGPLLSQLWVK